MKYKIEFINNEDYCRANGEITDEEWCMKELGIIGEPTFTDEYIITEDVIYSKDFKLLSIIEYFGQYYPKREKYDRISNSGYGELAHSVQHSIIGDGDTYVIRKDTIENYIIKPYAEFNVDYPNFNKEKYSAFMESLNDYYDNMHKK